MARPGKRTYLAVLVAIVLICGVGGFLATNWRSLVVDHYLRRANDPRADWPAVQAALKEVRRYDPKRFDEFWRRELEEINRREEPGESVGPLEARLEVERHFVCRGEREPFGFTVIIRNPTSEAVELLIWSYGYSVRHYPHSAWIADRRNPERWMPDFGGGGDSIFSPDQPQVILAPGREWRAESDFLSFDREYEGRSVGFYRIRIRWPNHAGGTLLSNWVTVVVLPADAGPKEPEGGE